MRRGLAQAAFSWGRWGSVAWCTQRSFVSGSAAQAIKLTQGLSAAAAASPSTSRHPVADASLRVAAHDPPHFPKSLEDSQGGMPPPSLHRRKHKKSRKDKESKSGSPAAADGTGAGATQTGPSAVQAPRTIADFPAAYSSFNGVTPLAEFKERYSGITAGEKSSDTATSIRVGGRVTSIRDMGKILFLTVRGASAQLQVIRQVDDTFTKAQLKRMKESLRVGDIIGALGQPGRTVKGELSLYASELTVLTPYVCTDQAICPDLRGFVPIADNDIKYRYRFVDMLTNPTAQEHFCRRHVMTRALRNYLDGMGFIEVETPMLHTVASGANAKPFVTHHNDNNTQLFLRVAPELQLKQCVVGGMERVYEIGRVFRNEDADRSHNPEFTSCEFYAAYHTYEDLMPITEDILQHMAISVNHSPCVAVTSCVTHEPVSIDLSKPFRRVSVYDEIQRVAGVELPPASELHTQRGLAYMSAIMLRYNIPLPSVRTAAKMFDKLIDYFITDRVVEPTFVMDHPLLMSPLAKEHATRPGLSERFELFINGIEYCNAYSELNDPREQYCRFQQQLLDKRTGDDEAMALDETFLKALQVGLPPTAGWGMGLDRVVMLLNGSTSIRDEIIFPLLRQDIDSHDARRRRKTASFFGFNHQMTLFCLGALEEEIIKRGTPNNAAEQVRQLRRCIVAMDRGDHAAALRSLEECRVSGWRYDVTMAVLRIFCGRSKS